MISLSHPARSRDFSRSRGTSLIEILVTIIILTFGLLGLAALQGKANVAELESYQRGQALILLQDMANRMENNRTKAADYVTSTALGTNATDATDCGTTVTPSTTLAMIDQCEWSKALKGASEIKTGTTTKQGAMIDGRGCIEAVTGTANQYRIAVVWQGLTTTSAPTTTACGSGLYGSELTRRAVTSIVQIADLAAP
jgi:type IV pilus assembly protein PilV